jgi:peptidoglycan/xylan/chitin deacetylase (PgdA/CDA1 family)
MQTAQVLHDCHMSIASLGYSALRRTGLTSLARWLRHDGVVLCYHNVVSAPPPGGPTLGIHIPAATFERQVHWLASHYTIVTLDEIVDRVVRREPLRGLAAITFDDGYAGVFEHAWPLLRELRIPATVFLVAAAHSGSERSYWWDDPDVLQVYSPQNERRWLTTLRGDGQAIVSAPRPAPAWCRPAPWSAIAAAAREGLGIGAHSATHRALPTLSDDELEREIVESRRAIYERSGVDPVLFAYPYGLWDERVRDAVARAGYRAAFTLGADHRTRPHDPWTLPRLSVPATITDSAFQAWTAGITPHRWRA